MPVLKTDGETDMGTVYGHCMGTVRALYGHCTGTVKTCMKTQILELTKKEIFEPRRVADNGRQTVCYWLSVVRILLAAGWLLFVVCWLLSVVCCLLAVVCCLLSGVCSLFLCICCLFLVVWCLPRWATFKQRALAISMQGRHVHETILQTSYALESLTTRMSTAWWHEPWMPNALAMSNLLPGAALLFLFLGLSLLLRVLCCLLSH